MEWFNSRVEFDAPQLNEEQVDQVVDALAELHPAVGTSPEGRLCFQLSVQAEDLPGADDQAVSSVRAALAQIGLRDEPVLVDSIPEDEFLRQQ